MRLRHRDELVQRYEACEDGRLHPAGLEVLRIEVITHDDGCESMLMPAYVAWPENSKSEN